MSRTSIMGCCFDPWDTKQTLNHIEELINQDKRGFLCTVNVSILMMMRSDPQLTSIINKSAMVVADGQPIIWASKYLNKALPERVTGVDLVGRLAELAEKNNWGVYLLGAKEIVIKGVIDRLRSNNPKLAISGYNNGYFDIADTNKQITKIKKSGAKILIVAMGVPRQEYLIDEHWNHLGVNFAIGVGGSFDVIAGFNRRAPVWMQKNGLEWFFRMLQEPKRLFGRYLRTNSLFIFLFFKELTLRYVLRKDTKQ